MSFRACVSVAFCLLVSVLPAQAGEAMPFRASEASDQAPEVWTYTVTPFAWGTGIVGGIGLSGQQPIDVDLDFKDTVRDLKFAMIATGEAHNGQWGILADVIFIRLKSRQGITRNVNAVPTALRSSIDTVSFSGSLMGEYRVVSLPKLTLDVMAGGRLWHVEDDVRARLGSDGSPVAEYSGSEARTWVDPMVGVDARLRFHHNWSLLINGMVGGFGIAADIDWSGFAGVGYDWNSQFTTIAGYRATGVDYRRNGFVHDVIEHGPVIGLASRF